jgi:NADH-quinone oxidoreductase subunit H
MTLDSTFQFMASCVWAFAVFGGILTLAGLMTWIERKLSAMMQDRIGPNRANIRIWKWNFTLIGLIHIMVDPIKLFTKEDYVPDTEHKVLHALGPMIGLFIPIVVFAVIPFAGPLHIQWKDIPAQDLCLLMWLLPDGWEMEADKLWLIGGLFSEGTVYTARDISPVVRLFGQDALHLSDYTIRFVIADLDVGMLFVFAIASLAVYSVILSGWSSNNKFSFLGAMRGANQMISYEVALGVTAVGIFMIYGGVSLSSIVEQQGHLIKGVVPKWGIVTHSSPAEWPRSSGCRSTCPRARAS